MTGSRRPEPGPETDGADDRLAALKDVRRRQDEAVLTLERAHAVATKIGEALQAIRDLLDALETVDAPEARSAVLDRLGTALVELSALPATARADGESLIESDSVEIPAVEGYRHEVTEALAVSPAGPGAMTGPGTIEFFVAGPPVDGRFTVTVTPDGANGRFELRDEGGAVVARQDGATPFTLAVPIPAGAPRTLQLVMDGSGGWRWSVEARHPTGTIVTVAGRPGRPAVTLDVPEDETGTARRIAHRDLTPRGFRFDDPTFDIADPARARPVVEAAQTRTAEAIGHFGEQLRALRLALMATDARLEALEHPEQPEVRGWEPLLRLLRALWRRLRERIGR